MTDPNPPRETVEPTVEERMFPIMVGRHGGDVAIPWAWLAPHEKQAIANHGQSLEKLANRGGLGIEEAAAIIEGRRWRERTARDEVSAWRLVCRAAIAAERARSGEDRERLMDGIYAALAVGEVRFGTNALARSVRNNLLVLTEGRLTRNAARALEGGDRAEPGEDGERGS